MEILRSIWFVVESLFWLVVVVGSLVLLGFSLAGDAPTYAAPVLGIFVLMLGLQVFRGVRGRRAAIVLTYLEQAVRLNLPLPQMLAAAAASEHHPLKSRLKDLCRRIESGDNVAVALEFAVPEIPPRALGLIHSSERVGRLPLALDRLLREQRQRQPRDPTEHIFYTAYPIGMTLVLASVYGLTNLFVLPKFQQIFHDFHVPLPGLTLDLLGVWHALEPIFAPMVLLGVTLFFMAAAWERFWPRRSGRWPIPAWFARNRDLADVCQVLADALDAGLPLIEAVQDASDLSVGWSLRLKLRAWVEKLIQARLRPPPPPKRECRNYSPA